MSYSFTMIDEALLEKIQRLQPVDRLELIEAVWESLAPDDLPITDAEKALLDARLAEMDSNPDNQSTWSDAKKRLEKLLP
jgi:putative addiction module component (TIGR02574 family)